MFRKVSYVVLAAAAILTALTALSTAGTLQAAPPTDNKSVPVYSFRDGEAVPGARSILRSDAAGVTVDLYTSGLPVGDTELWWYVFNAPEQCGAGTEGARCGLADLWNKAAQPSAFYGASKKIGDVPKIVQDYPPLASQFYGPNALLANGRADFLMRRAVGDPKDVVIGAGLTNPLGAEIHLILLSCVEGEGPAAGTASARRSCENRQYAVHQQQTSAANLACLLKRNTKCIRPIF